jgi:hypothetical protein
LPRYPVPASAGVVGWSPLRLRRGTFFGGAKQIVRERGRLRRQDLEGSPLTCRGRSSQATSYGDQGQEQGRGGHKVKKAVDAETSHHACANQRADDGAQPADQDEPSAYRNDSIGRHMIVRVGDTNRV